MIIILFIIIGVLVIHDTNKNDIEEKDKMKNISNISDKDMNTTNKSVVVPLERPPFLDEMEDIP